MDSQYITALADLSRDILAAFPHVHCFAWEDWRNEGGKWRSPGGRVLSDATYQRLKAAGEKGGGAKTAPKEKAPEKPGTEPHELGWEAWAKQEMGPSRSGGKYSGARLGYDPANWPSYQAAYMKVVEDALAAGKTVPASVLKDYPALANKATPKPKKPRGFAVKELDPASIAVDPARFQFKLKTDPTTGTGRELSDVQAFNPELAGVIAVWRDPADKKVYVVNGHHRLELAKRSGAKKILTRFLQAKTPEEARAKGALINIAEGRGTAVDAAKFLRDTGTTVDDLKKTGVSLSGAVVRDAVPLSNLDGGLFHKVTLGVIDVPRAVAIATHLPEHDAQRLLVGHLDREEKRTGRALSANLVAEAAKEMAATPKATVSGPGGGLFGNDAEEESIFLQRAELKSHVRQALAQQAKDFGLLASKRRAGNVAAAGNVIDTARNRLESERSKDLAADFDRSVNRSGAVSDAINKLAARYANAHTASDKDKLRREAVETVRKLISEGMYATLSEWVREVRPFWAFAWKPGKRGGRYWLPDGKQDVAPNRLYGAKAEAASKAGQGKQDGRGKRSPKGEPKPAEAAKYAQAKYDAAKDAHALASSAGSGVPADRVAWLKARMDKAKADLGGQQPKPAQVAPAEGGLLTPEDKAVVETRRKGLLGRIVQGIKDGYGKLQDRYGNAGAVATAAGIALTAPIPIPGAALVPVGVAEAVLRAKRMLGLADEEKPKGGNSLLTKENANSPPIAANPPANPANSGADAKTPLRPADPATSAAKALQQRLDLQRQDPHNATITPDEATHVLDEMRIRHTDAELIAIAKQVTGRGGRTAKQALAYLKYDMLALHRGLESQKV